VLDKLADLGRSDVMVVTHQPFISLFIYYFTGVETGMGTASIVEIRFEDLIEGCGEIEWIKHCR
jgi:broad specificity phosphatase PhoE